MEEQLKVLSKPVPLHRINYASLGFAGDVWPMSGTFIYMSEFNFLCSCLIAAFFSIILLA
jgi:hypothetical protein